MPQYRLAFGSFTAGPTAIATVEQAYDEGDPGSSMCGPTPQPILRVKKKRTGTKIFGYIFRF